MTGVQLLLEPRPAFGLDPNKAFTQYQHRVWRAEEGLPREPIFGITQTSDGYLWIGGRAGLVRFDGVRFIALGADEVLSISHSGCDLIGADSKGALWCGTAASGLIRYRNGSFEALGRTEGLASDSIRSIEVEPDGRVWAGTDKGLCRLDRGHVSTWTTRDGLPGDEVDAICTSAGGGIWVATSAGGIALLRDGGFTPLAGLPGDQAVAATALCEGRDGDLWIGTMRGLNHVKRGITTTYGTEAGLAHNVVSALLQDRHGNLWIGTHRGLSRLSAGKFSTWRTSEGPSTDMVSALYEDWDGSIWVGTYAGELTCISDTCVTPFGRSEGLSHDLAMPVCEDHDGDIWVGTLGGGLNRISKGGGVRAFTMNDGLPDNAVLSLLADPDGGLWIGTKGGGLCWLKDGRFRSYRIDRDKPAGMVLSLCFGRQRELWVGTSNGIYRQRSDGFSEIDTPIKGSWPALLYQSSTGSLWAGARSAGLVEIRDGRIGVYTTKDGLADDAIYCLYEDSAGTLWVGTEFGLSWYQHGRFTSLPGRGPPLSSEVFGILGDGAGNLWMSSLQGIFRMSRRDLLLMSRGATQTATIAPFGRADGMRTVECTGGFQSSACRDRLGRLWFPTTKGVVTIDPQKVGGLGSAPHVAMEELIADGQSVDLRRPVRLQAGTRYLEIRYTTPTLLTPEKIRFRYRLDGIQKDWTEAGTRRSAFLTDIPPGQHTFRVMALGDNVRGGAEATLDFYLTPHFYQRSWFYGLCGLSALAAGTWLYRVRTERLRARAAVLEERFRIARDLHDTLAQDLTGIRLQLDVAAGVPDPDAGQMQSSLAGASALLRRSVDEIRRVIWDLRRTNGLEGDLHGIVLSMVARMQAAMGANIEVTVEGVPRSLPLSTAHHLARIAHEAVSNALHHSSASGVSLRLAYSPTAVKLVIEDAGAGYDAGRIPTDGAQHFGVVGMQERAAKIGGKLSILTEAGTGTLVTVEVPHRAGTRGRRW